jgi:CRISPR/Cas system-associated exonuclease Cas4 (RecB family)
MIWPNYASLKYVKHEEFDSFEVDKCKVWTKIDLVTKMENGTIVITDWKTGKIGANSDENEAQIGAYVLWALDKLKVGEDSVKTEIAYLRDPAYRRKLTVVTKEQLAGVKKQIIECSRSMLAVNSVSDFPANPSARVCRDCPFATVCEEGVQHIPEDVREQPVSLHDKSIKSNSP